jgi:hypothetical protein
MDALQSEPTGRETPSALIDVANERVNRKRARKE